MRTSCIRQQHLSRTNPVIGNILASGSITPSDAQLKTNVTPLTDVLAKLDQLLGVAFERLSLLLVCALLALAFCITG
jgi:hypothetical protein